jgi:hypothetical protein
MFELMLAAALAAASTANCAVKSPAHTVALVELYTSQGCSSCPPADRWLSQLPPDAGQAQRVVPLALHVGYWDYIGWKDPFAQRAFNERQSWLAGLARSRGVYTPEVFVGSAEMRDWRSGATFEGAVKRINATPAHARIELGAVLVDRQVETRITAQADAADAQLFVALTSSGMQTAVKAGENRGETLRNDHVVRAWSGPLALHGGAVKWALPAGVAARDAQLVAFVQRSSNGEVLQAVSLPLGACAPS